MVGVYTRLGTALNRIDIMVINFCVNFITFLQKTIKCQNLNASSGVFTELGRRMTSFIFGSQPAVHRVTVSSLILNYCILISWVTSYYLILV